jgi:hypothetical protein
MVYETKISAALLELSEPYLATLANDRRYQIHVDYLDQVKSDARQAYSGLVQGMGETRLYSRFDVREMIGSALDHLPSYHPILTNQDRLDLAQKLTQQISTTTDQELKAAITKLRDAIEHRRTGTQDEQAIKRKS